MFTKELILAISNWQRGGSAKQKLKRSEALKAEAANLPSEFRQAPETCYRQIALTGSYLMNMGTHYEISESVSSWTRSRDVAMEFKGGVPPEGEYQGVIFEINPHSDCVIINIAALFENEEFNTEIKKHQASIIDFGAGIGRYGNSQQEIVLELEKLPLESLVAWGGYTSPERKLARMYFGYEPNVDELNEFRKLMIKSGHKPGAYWLFTPDAVDLVSEKLKNHTKRLSD